MKGGRWNCGFAAATLSVLTSATSIAASIDDLIHAYPDTLVSFDGSNLIWRDGTRMPVGDGRPDKSMEEQLRNGSILDQLRLAYPPAGAAVLRLPEHDPGRVRNRALFDKMYGDCKSGQVAPMLVPVVWLPKTWAHVLRITSVNGVDRQLAAISRELDEFPVEDKKYVYPLGGTYACRSVADTGQTSMHAWGAAIDINPALSDYWLWRRSTGSAPAHVKTIPLMSSPSLNATASSGADGGRTLTRCTSSSDPNFWHRTEEGTQMVNPPNPIPNGLILKRC